MSLSDRYAFGDFVLERSQRRVLKRDGGELALQPRLFDALLLFVERAGELLDKDSLMLALWPGLVVEENNLTQVISGLRRALGDDGSRFIQTVPRRGYRFIAAVTPLADGKGQSSAATDPPAPSPPQADRRRWLQWAGVAAAAAGLGGAAWWAWRRAADPDATEVPTLAVLPFKPLGGGGRDELLEVGMADSLIARLSTVPGLVVRSIGSVRRYAGGDQDPLLAARELNVTWIVDGSLQRRGDQLRVTARLLRAADGVAAWSDVFDERFSGVFDMQDLISNRVMQALAPRLHVGAGSVMPLVDLGGTHNTDAYQLYLAASSHALGQRGDGLSKSVALFKQALDIDPAYALAWSGLAESHRRMLLTADALPSRAYAQIDAALQRALALAPNLAQAHAALGFKLFWFDYDWPAGERAFRRAIAINPNVALAHFGLALMLSTQDRVEEGSVQMRLTRELDPMSPLFNTLEANFLLGRGQRAEARARLARTLDIAPNFWLVHLVQGLLHFAEDQPAAGIAALRRSVALADSSIASAQLAMHLVRTGEREEARAILNRLVALGETRHVAKTSTAAVHAALGETAPALGALEQAYLDRDTKLIYLASDPAWNRLRQEPRFVALLRTLKLDRFGAGLSMP